MSIADVELITQLELNTRVLHIAYVTDRTALAYVAWDRHLHQHAVGLLYIVVYCEGQFVVPESEVETQVGLLALLPLKVLVS